jgi:hypothetical protein
MSRRRRHKKKSKPAKQKPPERKMTAMERQALERLRRRDAFARGIYRAELRSNSNPKSTARAAPRIGKGESTEGKDAMALPTALLFHGGAWDSNRRKH